MSSRDAILALLENLPGASVHELAPRVGLSVVQTRKHLRSLREAGAAHDWLPLTGPAQWYRHAADRDHDQALAARRLHRALVEASRRITIRHAIEAWGCSPSAARRRLELLKQAGLVRHQHEAADCQHHWHLEGA